MLPPAFSQELGICRGVEDSPLRSWSRGVAMIRSGVFRFRAIPPFVVGSGLQL